MGAKRAGNIDAPCDVGEDFFFSSPRLPTVEVLFGRRRDGKYGAFNKLLVAALAFGLETAGNVTSLKLRRWR
jgi:hypothetical protein